MGYLQTAIEREASTSSSSSSSSSPSKRHQFIVYSPKCNVGRTEDGVIRGGERLVSELKDLIAREASSRATTSTVNEESTSKTSSVDFTLSFVGNSLGGLYARYAIAKLFPMEAAAASHGTSSGAPIIRPLIFCTTATPHLGVSRHTWIPIPSFAERFIGKYTMGETGRDLFLLSNLIRDMSTTQPFLHSLGQFRKRIAMANAFGTDFQVPLGTAAFLHSSSSASTTAASSTHWTVQDMETNNSQVVLQVMTEATSDSSAPLSAGTARTARTDSSGNRRRDRSTDQIQNAMAQSLDGLGWTKILVDMRDAVVNVYRTKLPDDMQSRTQWSSSELAQIFSSSYLNCLPFGHSLMVANTKSEWYGYLNAKGRPLMDDLAKMLVRDILDLDHGHEKETSTDARNGAGSKEEAQQCEN